FRGMNHAVRGGMEAAMVRGSSRALRGWAARWMVGVLIAAGCATGPHQQVPIAELTQPLEFSAGQTLKATKPSQVGGFGSAVAVSGRTAIVGATDPNAKGSAYLFERTDD